MTTNWEIGDRIQNRWEIHKILRGGMGIVYVVYDHELREPFAAKTFHEEIFAGNPAIAERFTQEALAWINLDVHQNVTQARFMQIISGKPLLFLEYVSGGDLSSWIGTSRLTEDLPQVLRFAIHLCDGMTYALSKGITAHRDLKPQNCLITQDGTLKITDFGLAKVVSMQEGEGGRGGTPEYMPPEQWDNFEQADERADIYSFGAMLYAMLIGHPPFGQRPNVSVRELERRHKEESPLPLNPEFSILSPIVEVCLAKDPARRFIDFRTLRGQLAGIHEGVAGEPLPEAVVQTQLAAWQWSNKGLSLSALGRNEGALACYDRAIELDRRNESAWSNKGVALGEMGRHEEAITCYDFVLGTNPNNGGAWSNKGMMLRVVGRYDEALVCCNHAIEINPRHVEAWINKGSALWAIGRVDECIGCFDRAIELYPLDERGWSSKAAALLARGHTEEAISCCDHAIQINPRYADVWSNRAHAVAAAGRLEESVTCCDRAIEIDPRHADAWVNKGRALGDLGRLEESITCCDHAIEINCRNVDAWFNKGVALWASRRPQDALACYDKAVELNPQLEKVWINRAAVLSEGLGRWQEAIACYDRVLTFRPHLPEAWFGKGATLAEGLQRYREALVCFEEAQRLGYVKATKAIAVCRRMLGHT